MIVKAINFKYYYLASIFLTLCVSYATPNPIEKKNLLLNHNNKINALARTPNNKYIVTGSWDGSITTWDVETGTIKHKINENKLYEKHFIIDVNTSSDSESFITTSSDHTATIWDIQTGTKKHILKGHSDFVMKAIFSNTGTFILTSSYDYNAIIWDLNGNIKHVLKHPDAVPLARISKNDDFVVTASKNRAYIWDVETGLCKHHLVVSGNITTLTISPNNKHIVTGDSTGTIVMWESNTGKPLYTITRHAGAIMTLSFSPDNKYIITGSTDLYTCITLAHDGSLKHKLHENFWVVCSAVSSDNKYLLTGGNFVSLRNLETGAIIQQFQNLDYFVTHLSFTPDNSFIVITREKAQSIALKQLKK